MKKYNTTIAAENVKIDAGKSSHRQLGYPVAEEILTGALPMTFSREVRTSTVETTVTIDQLDGLVMDEDDGNRTRIYLHTEFVDTAPRIGVHVLGSANQQKNAVRRTNPYYKEQQKQRTPIRMWYESEHGELLSRCGKGDCERLHAHTANIDIQEPLEHTPLLPENWVHEWTCSKHIIEELRGAWHKRSSNDGADMMAKRTKKALAAVRLDAMTAEALAGWTFRKVKQDHYGGDKASGAVDEHYETTFAYLPESILGVVPELRSLANECAEMLPSGDDNSYAVSRAQRRLRYAGRFKFGRSEHPFRALQSAIQSVEWTIRRFEDDPRSSVMSRKLDRIIEGYDSRIHAGVERISQVLLRSNLTTGGHHGWRTPEKFQKMLSRMSSATSTAIVLRIDNVNPIWETTFNDESEAQ